MKTKFSKQPKTSKWIFLLSLLFLISSCSKDDEDTNNGIIESSQFKTDADNWKIVGDAQGGYVEASYSPDGGKSNGYIYAVDDVTGGVWYFAAPNRYLGEQTGYYDSTLEFSLFQNSSFSDQFEYSDIIFKSGDQQIYYRISSFPGTEWTGYSIKINDQAGWMKGEFDTGIPATKSDIKAVLSNLTAFWIRGEYEDGSDDGGLDNVLFTK